MSAFLYGVGLHWRMDLRNREVVIVYYVVPLIFFLFMGGFFSAVMPGAEQTLIQSMTVFGATMGAMIGSPAALAETTTARRARLTAWAACPFGRPSPPICSPLFCICCS